MNQSSESNTLSIRILDRIREEISRTSRWLKFLGILSVVVAPLSILASFFRLILSPGAGVLGLAASAVSGILSVILAVFLLSAAGKGKSYAGGGQPAELISFHGRLGAYFVISGILIVILLAGLILGVIMLATTGFIQQLL